jgi:GT2 family glycosyltransferase
LNPDTCVQPGALDELVNYLDQHPPVGACGSCLFNPDGSLQPACYPFPTLGREAWRLLHLDRLVAYGVYDLSRWDLQTPRPVDVIQGTSIMLRRQALDQVGLLDESYYVYTEEVDLCYRLHQAGWQLVWVPRSRVTHYGGQSTQQVAQSMFISLYKTKTQYFRKHQGRGAAFAYRMILLFASLLRLAGSAGLWLVPAAKREKQRQIAANYLHLIRQLPAL